MHIEYIRLDKAIVVAHDDPVSVLAFDCSLVYYAPVFKKVGDKDGVNEHTLDYLNLFIQSRTREQQRELMRYYSTVHALLYQSLSASIIDERLPSLLTAFPKIPGFTPADVLNWVTEHVEVPDDIMTEYKDDVQGIYSRTRTYIRQEYLDLAALIMYSKLLMPIMGDYMRRLTARYKSVAKEVNPAVKGESSTSFKSHVEMSMLDMLHGFMEQVPGVTRLSSYIDACITNINIKPESLVLGKQICYDDLPKYVFAVVFTTKLVGGGFYATKSHIASRLHTNIRNIVSPSSEKSSYLLTNDGINREMGDEAKSVYDDTTAQYDLSVGQIAILQYCTTDEYLLRFMEGRIDLGLYHHLCNELQAGNSYVTKFHVACIGLCLSNVVNPSILSHCGGPTLLRMIALTYLLIRDKFPVVAAVLIGFPMVDETLQPLEDHVDLAKLTPTNMNILLESYPLKTKHGVPLARQHILDIAEALQYIWVGFTSANGRIDTDVTSVNIPPDFLSKYLEYMCAAPYILNPPQPA